MKGLAFITDPDGYWIEILQANMIEKTRVQVSKRNKIDILFILFSFLILLLLIFPFYTVMEIVLLH